MDLGIKGRTAIICASSKGLGRGCAEALAQEGCNIIVNGRDEASTFATAEAIAKLGTGTVKAIIADVSKPDGRAALLEAAPNPDILINNNGGPPRRDFREIDDQAILEGVNQNMVTPLALIKAVIDGMAERGFGRIVNITSASVYMPIEGLDLSSGARAGLTAFLAGVTPQFAASNVTINNLLPGKFDTNRLRGALKAGANARSVSEDDEAKRQAMLIPAKRFGTPEEFGQIAAFLCSAQASYLTGQNILADGGLHTRAF